MNHRLASGLYSLILFVTAAGLLNACKGGSGEDKAVPQPAASPAPAAPAPAPAPAAPQPGPAQPAPAPAAGKMDFSIPLQPITELIAGFSIYKGKQVLIFYFGPTCPHCQHAFPQVQAFADEIRPRGVETVAIANMRSNPEEIRGFIAQYRAKIPVYWDADRKFGEAYDVKSLPTLYLVGKTGDVFKLENFSGTASLDSLRARL